MEFPVHIPFIEHLGFELLHMEAGEAELALVLRPELLNSWNVAHGGLLMTLLDVAMAHAARSFDGPQGPGVVTVEMKTSFMRPGEGRLHAKAKVLHRSTTLAFCEGSVSDDAGLLCAHATGCFKYLRALPARDRQLKALQRKS
jgi:uncharacterized protein (TIGR00369 family)